MQPVQPENRRVRRAHSAPSAADVPAAVKERRRKRKVGNLIAMIVLAVFVLVAALYLDPIARNRAENVPEALKNNTANGVPVSAYKGLVISEVMSSNKSAMPDEEGNYPDWVEIWNNSGRALSMLNVGLSDDANEISFRFPDITLQPDERVIVLCDKKNQAVAGKPLHAKFGLSSSGDTVVLFDPAFYQIDRVDTPIMSADESYALQADGAFAQTKQYSPGYANSEEGYLAYRSATMVTDGAVIINEICPDPMTGYRDAAGELCDWIELHNKSNVPVSLENYALSNNENKPLKWRFPEGAYIPPNGYYLVYCSGKDVLDENGVPHTNFRVSAEHDTIVLSDNRERMLDRVTLDNIPEDASYARGENGEFTIHLRTTPLLPNTEAGANTMDAYLRSTALNPSGVYITEVMLSNDSTETTVGADYVDWVEIYNPTNVTVDLSNYGFSDKLTRARRWQFPEGTYISPGEYKLIWCDGDTARNTAAEPHTSFKLSKSALETLVLADPTGRILDKIVLPAVPTNVSYGRTTGREGFFYYDEPTPMDANGTGFLGYAEAPQLTVPGGLHDQGVKVGFTMPENTTVFYTTNGADPTPQNGIVYTGQVIELTFTTVLRACAYPHDSRYQESEIVTGTYLINRFHDLPVVCLTVDPEILWNPVNGMLVTGEDVVKEPGKLPFPNTIYRRVKDKEEAKEGYLEYYTPEGEQLLSQGVAVGLIGDFSLDMPQKSFKLRAKSLYGEKTFAAAVFDDRPYTEYKSLVLRNSGNDCMWTRLLDGFQSRLLDYYGSEVIHQAWDPVAVYLNGVYWGHYNLRERVDRFFVAQFEGLPLEEADNMDIIQGSGSVHYGSNAEYRAMLKKIKAGDPAKNPEDLQYILDNVDVDNFFEYMALEMFVGNSDIGNTRYYRLHGIDPETGEPYKWKWIWYDADYGLFDSSFNSPRSYQKEKGMGQMNIDNTIFRKLLSVPEYKRKFLEKLADVYKTFTTENMLSVLEPMVAQITPEMSLHWDAWGELNDKYVIAEVPTTVDGAYAYWELRVNRLRNVIRKRPTLLWGFIKDEFHLTEAEMVELFGPQPEMPADAI